MDWILAYFERNKEWLFSGIGLAAVTGAIASVRFMKRKLFGGSSENKPDRPAGHAEVPQSPLRQTAPQAAAGKPGPESWKSCEFKAHDLVLEKIRQELKAGQVLVWLDIDKLTQIDQIFGEECGDAVIQRTQRTIFSVADRLDVPVSIFHAGHRDEFYIVGPCEILNEAVAETVITAIRRSDWSRIAPQLYVTCSAGIASHRDDPTDTLQRARFSLNCAKNQGGDTVGPEVLTLNPLETVCLFSS